MRVPLGMLVRVTGIESIVAPLVAGFVRVPDVADRFGEETVIGEVVRGVEVMMQ